jgi:DNA-directed RNA polymerase subunit beta
MTAAVRNSQIQDVDDEEIDVEIPFSTNLFSTHVNSIPLQNSVAAPRLFYGARFVNQAVPLINREAPLVQNLMGGMDRTIDEDMGDKIGALRSKFSGVVKNVTPDYIEFDDEETGETKQIDLYNNQTFNRKTSMTQFAKVKPGDRITPGQLLATSNYTDDNGTMAMGLNARIGLVAYKGHSMDDAIVISDSFAKRLTSQQTYVEDQEFDENIKGGKGHFHSLFPTEYTKDQLDKLDDHGVIKVGQKVNTGDPFILASKPKMFSSNEGALGKLSRAMKTTRQNSSKTWDHEDPGTVLDVAKTKKGYNVVIQTETATRLGDKVVLRPGAKGIVSLILPDEHMPRTTDGQPLEVLLNPLSLPSRVNTNTVYSMILGKLAKKRGKPYRIPGFNKMDEKWYDFVEKELADNGMTDKERVFDPLEQKELENPILVGYDTILKLHHLSESKTSARGQGSYDANFQPLKGGSQAAQSKRLSTLELGALMSSGAYATMREGSTLRGSQNDEYWRALRQRHSPKDHGAPFVWEK